MAGAAAAINKVKGIRRITKVLACMVMGEDGRLGELGQARVCKLINCLKRLNSTHAHQEKSNLP